MTQPVAASTDADIVDELGTWLHEHWDPEVSVGEWWQRLGLAGWAAPSLPEAAYGRGLSRTDAVGVVEVIAQFGALGPPGGLGILLAAPTIATHGTPAQIERYVRDIVTGQAAWCQLFSEPSAGSDLAGLQTRAVKDGDEWVVNGQKVWTSGGQVADYGMLLARTDPSVPNHQGITYFALDMHQAGVDVHPLREMTGRALFNEVFFTDARTTDDAVIGGVNRGWAVANTTLAFERAGLGSGGSSAAAPALPGTVAGHLGRRAGDFVSQPSGGGNGRANGAQPDFRRGARGGIDLLIDVARRRGRTADPLVRQKLAELFTWSELGRMNGLRLRAARQAGQDIPGMPNIGKLSMSHIVRLSRDLGLALLGPSGTLHGYDDEERAALSQAGADPSVDALTEMALLAQAPPIYGGTDQIQRNIIGERVLGLPKETSKDSATPFAELPKNT